jgi:hypothetical protein
MTAALVGVGGLNGNSAWQFMQYALSGAVCHTIQLQCSHSLAMVHGARRRGPATARS